MKKIEGTTANVEKGQKAKMFILGTQYSDVLNNFLEEHEVVSITTTPLVNWNVTGAYVVVVYKE